MTRSPIVAAKIPRAESYLSISRYPCKVSFSRAEIVACPFRMDPEPVLGGIEHAARADTAAFQFLTLAGAARNTIQT